ncbi:MAG: Gfo/Idh/MocA family protein [Xanthobacteraceae bacterium]|jgi:predicted dehydrogenase
MATNTIGIIVNGATGRIGSTQHLQNALVAICREGGLAIGKDRIVPRLLLVGRDGERLDAVAKAHEVAEWTTDLDAALENRDFAIFFDAAATHQRPAVLEKAILAGKHIYCEKPVATSVAQGLGLLRAAEARGLKAAVVEDKVYLPGLQKLAHLAETGFFGRVVNFRLEFGWWVFDGVGVGCQRPSWNYRRASGGGLILDMVPHWRYLVEDIVGPIARVVSAAWTATPERVDERGERYRVDVEDSCAVLVALQSGAYGTILSSWATRVRRDDLLTLQVDGTHGSAIAGLHRCWTQTADETPRIAHFNVKEDIGADYRAGWREVPAAGPYRNPYRIGWEQFLRHIVVGAPLRATFAAGIRDLALAEACARSMKEDRWVTLDARS